MGGWLNPTCSLLLRSKLSLVLGGELGLRRLEMLGGGRPLGLFVLPWCALEEGVELRPSRRGGQSLNPPIDFGRVGGLQIAWGAQINCLQYSPVEGALRREGQSRGWWCC